MELYDSSFKKKNKRYCIIRVCLKWSLNSHTQKKKKKKKTGSVNFKGKFLMAVNIWFLLKLFYIQFQLFPILKRKN